MRVLIVAGSGDRGDQKSSQCRCSIRQVISGIKIMPRHVSSESFLWAVDTRNHYRTQSDPKGRTAETQISFRQSDRNGDFQAYDELLSKPSARRVAGLKMLMLLLNSLDEVSELDSVFPVLN